MSAKVCIWTYDEDQEVWETSCGDGFCLNEGSPITNKINFCPFCGEKVKVAYEKP